ncbi:MAG: suppressor of fused domain protein [Clostridiales Family XIII bacterium]|jgi:hypothetical protein|nr:suppressor of fused domain protein [Clostridiales Family XIII bacterium]
MKKEEIIQLFSSRLDPPAHCYSEKEAAIFRAHVEARFGTIKKVLREPYAQDVRADVAILDPAPGRPFYTLVTIGMGAFVMDVPQDLIDCELERAELMFCLPSSWNPEKSGDKWRWPLEWLRILAHIPAEKEMWLGWGHMVPIEEPVAKNLAFSCMLLIDPVAFEEAASYCEMPDGSIVNIYQVLPVFEDEMKFRQAQGTDALLEIFEERLGRRPLAVLDVSRRSCLAP